MNNEATINDSLPAENVKDAAIQNNLIFAYETANNNQQVTVKKK